MLVIVGLGNPGNEYKNTYHNVGFIALDAFAKNNNLKFTSKKYNSQVAKGCINGENFMIVKPQTYMNLSGTAVSEIVRKLKLPLSNLLVICDDADLPLGTIRYRKVGSGGTHNGMKNIVERLSATNFARIKIGIGRDDRMPLEHFVLSVISPDNKKILEEKLEKVTDIIFKFIETRGQLEGETIS